MFQKVAFYENPGILMIIQSIGENQKQGKNIARVGVTNTIQRLYIYFQVRRYYKLWYISNAPQKVLENTEP